MAAETGFLIDGTTYEVPPLYTFDNDECVILFDYCGLVQEDFAPQEGEEEEDTDERNARQMRHPGFWLALMHVAYRRKHRELKDAKIKALVGKLNRQDTIVLGEDDKEDEPDVPLGLTSEPAESSRNDSLENANTTVPLPDSSGTDSTNDSGQQDATPARIGTTRSDTSSLESHRETSVA